jgi:hypothetical protein
MPYSACGLKIVGQRRRIRHSVGKSCRTTTFHFRLQAASQSSRKFEGNVDAGVNIDWIITFFEQYPGDPG